jgi:MFS family permease
METFKHDFTTGYTYDNGRPGMYPNQVSLIVAMLSAGTAIGALLSAPIGDRWGRRLSLIFAIGVFCIGAIFQVCAKNVALLVVGRYVVCVSFPPALVSRRHGASCSPTSMLTVTIGQ